MYKRQGRVGSVRLSTKAVAHTEIVAVQGHVTDAVFLAGGQEADAPLPHFLYGLHEVFSCAFSQRKHRFSAFVQSFENGPTFRGMAKESHVFLIVCQQKTGSS